MDLSLDHFVINYVGQGRIEVVKRLLSQINLPMKIECLLMDGGFNDAELFEFLDCLKIKFLVRGGVSKKKRYPSKVGPNFTYITGKNKYLVEYINSPKEVKMINFSLLFY
ncbi:MAG: hypothetical protein OEZ01_05670 [Candidatus Heimdallarchaeota archaeon]|nr:hypothetical protein [Candidatus Heimdallarchaeota archaeon]MDH5645473.1 hypothetical protein [Candidatus Heimdallarchaeota archaeon]